MLRLLIISGVCLSCSSCVSSLASGTPCDVQPFPEEFVKDMIPLPEQYEMEDIAFSFPAFEIGAERIKEHIRSGNCQGVGTKTSWTLLGDGAQSTVRFDRLSKDHEQELTVRVAFGPVFEAYQYLPDPTFVYEFRRGIGGWHKLSYKRVFSTASQETLDISQKPTAEQDAPSNGG